jgi:hypothetical protein
MPPNPPSKELPSLSEELPSLSASTIDTLFSFPRKLQIAFPRELQFAYPRELQIAFPREPPLMPELPATSPGKLPAQHWSILPLQRSLQFPAISPGNFQHNTGLFLLYQRSLQFQQGNLQLQWKRPR